MSYSRCGSGSRALPPSSARRSGSRVRASFTDRSGASKSTRSASSTTSTAGPTRPRSKSCDVRKIEDLIEEANSQNHVTVTVYRGIKGETGIRHRKESEDRHPVTGQGPSVIMADIARMLKGKKPIYFDEAIRRCGGELVGAF